MLPVSHNYMSLDFKLKRTLRGLGYPCQLWNPVWLGPLERHEIEELYNQPIDLDDLYSEAIDVWDACGSSSLIDKTLQFFTRLYLQDDIMVKADRASMLNSLEVRSPFLDIELVDFVRRIPSCYKFRNGQTKYTLKRPCNRCYQKVSCTGENKGSRFRWASGLSLVTCILLGRLSF